MGLKSVTLSLKTGDSIIEQLVKQANIKKGFAVRLFDIKLINIQEFNATVEVQYQE